MATCNISSGAKCMRLIRPVDQFLQKLGADTDALFALLDKDPEQLATVLWLPGRSPLCTDSKCRIAAGDPYSPFCCVYCSRLRDLIDQMPTAKSPITATCLECGNFAGKQLIVRVWPHVLRMPQITRTATHLIRIYRQQVQSIMYLLLDEMTLSLMVQVAMQQVHVPLPDRAISAFMCSTSGYSVSVRQRDIIPWTDLSGEQQQTLAPTALRQILTTYIQANDIQLFHGTPSLHALGVADEQIMWTDLTTASLTLATKAGPVRICRGDMFVRAQMQRPPTIDVHMAGNGTYAPVKLFKLGNYLEAVYWERRTFGELEIQGPIEVYAWMLAFAAEEHAWSAIMADRQLNSLWNLLWLSKELDMLHQVVAQLRRIDQPTFEQILHFLVGFYVRADALKLVADRIYGL